MNLVWLVALLMVVGCARNPDPELEGPAPEMEPMPTAPPVALADTTVCVVSPMEPSGLSTVAAKTEVGTGRVVVVRNGQNQPFEQIYPTTATAGYAGGESWFVENERITLDTLSYVKAGVRRRIQPEQVTRSITYRGVPVFVDPRDPPPPEALYVPVQPGCIFQAYIREEYVRKVRGNDGAGGGK